MIGRMLALTTVAAACLAPAAHAGTALPSSCSVSLAGPSQCLYVASIKTLTGRLNLSVSGGYVAVAGVSCTVGGASDAGIPPYSNSTDFTRAGVCILQISGSGTASASSN